jgi:hypothetical protein
LEVGAAIENAANERMARDWKYMMNVYAEVLREGGMIGRYSTAGIDNKIYENQSHSVKLDLFRN